MACGTVGGKLNVEHPLGNDTAFAAAGQTGVLDGVFEIEKHAGLRPRIALVDQHRAALEQITLPFEGEIEHRVQQRMARADEGGRRLAGRRHQLLFKGDALVARQHRLADPDQTIAVANQGRHVGHLETAGLAPFGRAAQAFQRLRKNDSM